MTSHYILIGILNFLAFLFSIPILLGGIWLSHQANSECEKFLDTPLIILGVFLIVFSLAGLIGTCCNVSWLRKFYFVVVFILIVLLLCLTIFSFFVTKPGGGRELSGKEYKEYRLDDYSEWSQNRVKDTKNWSKIKSCLLDSKVCSRFARKHGNDTDKDFYDKHLSAVQSGCCKPPNDCGFTYVGPTTWTKTSWTYTNPDCDAWDNDPRVLCFNCQSCKAGLLDKINSDWKKVASVNVVLLLIEIGCFVYSCIAEKRERGK